MEDILSYVGYLVIKLTGDFLQSCAGEAICVYSYIFLCEVLSVFPTLFSGHGLLLRDYIRDYAKLQEGPFCPLVRVPD